MQWMSGVGSEVGAAQPATDRGQRTEGPQKIMLYPTGIPGPIGITSGDGYFPQYSV